MKFLSRMACVTVLAFGVTGCATGVHTIRVNTEPQGAMVFHKSKPLGETPVNVPMRWYVLGGGWLATVPIRIELDGYETVDRPLPAPVNKIGEPPVWREGSEFGRGKTAEVTIKLNPVQD